MKIKQFIQIDKNIKENLILIEELKYYEKLNLDEINILKDELEEINEKWNDYLFKLEKNNNLSEKELQEKLNNYIDKEFLILKIKKIEIKLNTILEKYKEFQKYLIEKKEK